MIQINEFDYVNPDHVAAVRGEDVMMVDGTVVKGVLHDYPGCHTAPPSWPDHFVEADSGLILNTKLIVRTKTISGKIYVYMRGLPDRFVLPDPDVEMQEWFQNREW